MTDNLGPNNLRALAYYGSLSDSDRKRLSDCADAWEADIDQKEAIHKHFMLQARIEALERDNAALREAAQDMLDATVEGHITIGHQKRLHAALASQPEVTP